MCCATGHGVGGRAGLWWKRIHIDGIPRVVGHCGVMGGLLGGGEAEICER
jgi:hypothetical protein